MALADVRVIVKTPFGPPETPAFSMPLVTDSEWDSLAERSNVWRFDVDPKAEEPRIAGVAVDWQYGTDDTRRHDWALVDQAEEAVEVARVRALLDAEAAESGTDADRRAEIADMVQELAEYAFWQEKRNAFGDGTVALYRGCNSANIGYHLRSNRLLDTDRPFTLWLHRCKPAEGQEDCRLRLQFGDWRLEFSQQNKAQLTQLVEMTAEERAALEDELETTLDAGRLTADDKEQIAEWKDDIDTLKATAKKARRDLTEDEDAQVAAIEADIDDLRAGKKGYTGAEQLRIDQLRAALYEQTVDVNLAETTETLFGTDLPITVIPQRRGYLSIHLGRGANYSVVEVKTVTATRDYGTVIRSTPFEISGNGGALWFKFSYVDVAKTARIVSASRNMGFDVPETYTFTADWSADTGAAATLDTVTNGTSFYWTIDITTDGEHMPFIYAVNLQVAATERDSSGERTVYDSNIDPASLADFTPKWNTDNRSRGMTVDLTNIGERWEPARWVNHQVFVYEGGECIFTGVIIETPVTELTMVDGREVERVGLECADRWALLMEDVMVTQLVGDGQSLATYVGWVVQSRGFAAGEINVEDSGFTLPKALPGQEPLVRNEWGKSPGEFLGYLYEHFGHGLEMGFDEDGEFYWRAQRTATRPDVVFRRRSPSLGYEFTIWDVERRADHSEFYNDFIVIGSVKVGSKRDRYAARYRDWGSVHDATAENYWGSWKPMPPRQDDALNTQELVNGACRHLQVLYGAPRHEVSFRCRYSDDVQPWMTCYLEDELVQVVSVSSAGRGDNTMDVTVRVL